MRKDRPTIIECQENFQTQRGAGRGIRRLGRAVADAGSARHLGALILNSEEESFPPFWERFFLGRGFDMADLLDKGGKNLPQLR